MNRLSQEKKQFIDDNFYEGIGNKLSRAKFDQLLTAEELHYLAEHHNWDDGTEVLQWIAEHEQCAEATALMLFWLAQPDEYLTYSLKTEFKNEDDNRIFLLIKTILVSFQKGFYKKSTLHFDPVSSRGETEPPIPAFMLDSTKGEETYVYYEESEVDSWFDEVFENKVRNCPDAMTLFNIASFVESPEKARMICQSPLCDKGIAIMVFWRLKTFAGLWTETGALAKEIVEKVRTNEYQEVLSYDPAKDKNIKMKAAKQHWEIPQVMTQAV